MEPILSYCDACHRNPGEIHVTVEVYITRPKSVRTKVIQFWLCAQCERKNRILLSADDVQRNRVAQALTPTPTWWKEPLIPMEADNGR